MEAEGDGKDMVDAGLVRSGFGCGVGLMQFGVGRKMLRKRRSRYATRIQAVACLPPGTNDGIRDGNESSMAKEDGNRLM